MAITIKKKKKKKKKKKITYNTAVWCMYRRIHSSLPGWNEVAEGEGDFFPAHWIFFSPTI
jgi:hypothetical protein